MGAELTKLKKVGQVIVEGEKQLIVPRGKNGREIGLQYMLANLAMEGRHPGKLLVHHQGTSLGLYTKNWSGGTQIIDYNGDGKRQLIVPNQRPDGVDLGVIMTEIWLNDIGVRIRHVA
jgi:hypothetical protein